MYDLLWLLLPVAAASGWIAARRAAPSGEQPQCPEQRDSGYFKGLNYVLNEQPDKAIDLFVKMVEVDHETVETHLALGNLFRRRGEVDRAIRIHQNLISRDTLSPQQRALSLLELGQDYMRAGLFDRAENLFQELVESGFHREQALHNLRTIYEQEREWDKCLETARRLEQVSGQRLCTEQAHYHCEKADLAYAAGATEEAIEQINRARRCNEGCVRATMLLGQMEMDQREWQRAITTLLRVETLDATYFPVVLPDLLKCHQRLASQSTLRQELQRIFERRRGRAELLTLTDLIQSEEGDEIALSFLSNHLQQHPSLEGIERLISLDLKTLPDHDHGGTLRVIRPLISQLIEHRTVFQCQRCGFSARDLHWQCPGCKSWHSIKPT